MHTSVSFTFSSLPPPHRARKSSSKGSGQGNVYREILVCQRKRKEINEIRGEEKQTMTTTTKLESTIRIRNSTAR